MKGQIRQGDVLLVPVDVSVPEGVRTSAREVLAEGEATGHFHTLTAEKVARWEDFVCVLGDTPGVIAHPEHDPKGAAVVIPGQVYKVVRQREYTLNGMWQQVQD